MTTFPDSISSKARRVDLTEVNSWVGFAPASNSWARLASRITKEYLDGTLSNKVSIDGFNIIMRFSSLSIIVLLFARESFHHSDQLLDLHENVLLQ